MHTCRIRTVNSSIELVAVRRRARSVRAIFVARRTVRGVAASSPNSSVEFIVDAASESLGSPPVETPR